MVEPSPLTVASKRSTPPGAVRLNFLKANKLPLNSRNVCSPLPVLNRHYLKIWGK